MSAIQPSHALKTAPTLRENNLTFVRFFIAFMVLIRHIIDISQSEAFILTADDINTFPINRLFFCISGLLITGSYLSSRSLSLFFQKRARRLLPLYWIVIFLSVIIGGFLSTYSLNDYYTHPQLWRYLWANLSFLNFMQTSLPGVFTDPSLIDSSVNGALWTLKIEVGFYLTVPIILYFVQKVKRKYLVIGGLYLFAILYRYILLHYYHTTGESIYFLLFKQYPGYLSYFMVGMALYYYFDLFIRHKRWFVIIGLVVFVVELYLDLHLFTPLAVGSVLFGFAYSVKSLNNFGKYGDFSYGIYLVHCPIIKWATEQGYFERYNPFLVAFIIILCVFFLAFLSWNLIEKRCLKRG